MIVRSLVVVALAIPATARAGGLTLPGSGAISTSRAGAAIASADDGEALALNPAGLANVTGTVITVSAAAISYSMEFTRRGTYDALPTRDAAFEGQEYGTVKNNAKPPLGIGSFQPIPIFAVATDLGGKLGDKVRLGAGLYGPNAYPFRNMRNRNGVEYIFNNDDQAAPPGSRYDILEQEAAVLLPSVAASFRVSPKLDIGVRASLAFADIKSTTTIWGGLSNVVEDPQQDAEITVSAKDSFIPAFGVGVTFHATPNLDLAAVYSSQVTIHAKGEASSVKGPGVTVNGEPFEIGPIDGTPRCAAGGSFEAQKACVDFALPMTATLGARYKMLDANGKLKGDIELNLGWENWSAELVSSYRVVVDADVYINDVAQLSLKDNILRHEYKDVFTARLGGSYHIPQGANTIILRGGLGHDTRAAKEGWLRADVDGAARTTFAFGGAYRAKKFQIDLGGGFIYEGSPENAGDCNILEDTPDTRGCNMDGNERPLDQRNGPDPINPLVVPNQQTENPIAQGTYKAHYKLIMLGFSTWF
jgi:long-subunit fatty acid transport protein